MMILSKLQSGFENSYGKHSRVDARDPCGLSAFLCVVPLLGNVVRLTVNISLCFLLFIYAFFIDLFSFIKKEIKN